MKSVVLSGFMGTGKSTVGPRLAARLGIPFVDTDAEIERAAGRTIAELWRDEGEGAFRAREAALAERWLTGGSPLVVAFGGGTVTGERTRRLAIDRALVVTLTASADTVVARVPDVPARPNLALGGDPVARARELMAQREAAYAECHLAVSTDALGVDAVVGAIMALVARDPLVVPLGTRSYCVDVCDGDGSHLTHAVARCAPSKLVLVTDSNVERMRGAAIDAALRPLDLPGTRVTLPPGERHKTLASVGAIWDAALGAGVDRDAVVVAVGGGVVGDLAGFASACLLRGVRFVQVPTTLLAMVDASVGGKTGFDHPVGKNLIGAFHQPSGVVVDLAHLETLPAREYRAGLAEVAKVALAIDAPLLERLERDAKSLVRGDRGALMPAVREAIQAKIRIVRDDEREAGARALLNLGHTIGHALEAHGGYSRWLHGEAVALGLLAEVRATAALGWTPPALVERAHRLLEALGLPAKVSAAEIAAAWPYVGADKKRAGDAVRFVVVTAPGVSHVQRVPLVELREAVLRGL
ncbi:MAG TPA: 3-dehydroquinate synthase [Polyangiaceae bacterium]|nr:3-dehydroquinate synthase [Polyangiaceae bacterium]